MGFRGVRNEIDIRGLPKNAVLVALYNATTPMGSGCFHDMAQTMTPLDADKYMGPGGKLMYFDYLMGRPIKTDIGGDSIDPRLFDRDAGEGAAAAAIDAIR